MNTETLLAAVLAVAVYAPIYLIMYLIYQRRKKD